MSLFAFISDLCPNRQVAGGGMGSGAGIDGLEEKRRRGWMSRRGGGLAGGCGQGGGGELPRRPARAAPALPRPPDRALRLRPPGRRHRRRAAARPAGRRHRGDGHRHPPARSSTTSQLDVAKIYDGRAEPELDAIRALKVTVNECARPAPAARRPHPGQPPGPAGHPVRDLRRAEGVLRAVRQPGRPGRARDHERGDAGRITASDSICTALQLVEHTQDVAEDLGQRPDLPAARGPGALRRDRGRPGQAEARKQTSDS